MAQFDYTEFTFHKSESNRRLLVRGEVCNRSGKDFTAVAIRIVLFNRNIALANFVVVLNGFPNGGTKRFEREAEELLYDDVAKLINRYDVMIESAY